MLNYWLNLTFLKMGFWITWTIIPVVIEIIPALVSAFNVYSRAKHRVKPKMPTKLPLISVLVPVYNSAATLFACLDSISQSTYPSNLIQVIVADNGSSDNSFGEFARAQEQFSDLNMQLLHTDHGKATALNSSIYAAFGTYVINIDSDGTLEKHALMNMVLKFENDLSLAAMTGTILSRKDMVQETKSRRLRHIRQNEYFEYAQAFLSGRTIESAHNQLFTMSGAFSAFRRNVLQQTYMYNPGTVGEDTDMTFQIRERLGSKVALCQDAIFYIEPISGWQQLYTQRQRWQRGELEVTKNFANGRVGLTEFFKNFLVRRMMIDHTFMFPKMIWFFASFVLLFFRYSPVVMAASYIVIYFLYVIVSMANYICVRLLLDGFPDEARFYRRLWWVGFTLPAYNFVCSWFRLIGTINTLTQPKQWNAMSARSEWQHIRTRVTEDIHDLKKGQ